MGITDKTFISTAKIEANNQLGSLSGVTLVACALVCLKTSRCYHFAFDENLAETNCLMYNYVPSKSMTINDGFKAYRKRKPVLLYNSDWKSYSDGLSYCKSKKGTLVMPKTEEKWNIVVDISNAYDVMVRVGVRDDNILEFTDGTLVSDADFHIPVEDDSQRSSFEDCFGVSKGLLQDKTCSWDSLPFVCEIN